MVLVGTLTHNDELYVYGNDYTYTDSDDHKSYLAKLADNSLEPIGDGVPNVILLYAVIYNNELYVYGVEIDTDSDDHKSYLAKLADDSLGSRLEPIGDGVPSVIPLGTVTHNDELYVYGLEFDTDAIKII